MPGKTIKNNKKKYSGGGNNDDMDATPIEKFDIGKPYSSKELGLVYKHALSLHHNKMDLNIIANLNMFKDEDEDKNKNKNSIYYPKKDWNPETIKKHITDNILYKYYTPKELKYFEIDKSKLNATGWFGGGQFFRMNIFVGEGLVKISKPEPGTTTLKEHKLSTVPIFMVDDDTGYFYDIHGTPFIPTFEKGKSKNIGKIVYIFCKEGDYENKNIDVHAGHIYTQLNDGKMVGIDTIMEASGINNDVAKIKYMFDRVRITKQQTDTIGVTFLDYNILYNLNNDTTKIDGKFTYKPSERFNFFSYEKIAAVCKKLGIKDVLNMNSFQNEQYERCFLVGFTIPYNSIRRPVYLKSNGYFSDGGADYFPTFQTITIDGEMLKKISDDGWKWELEFLQGKVAYEFSWGPEPETIYNILYNDYFRNAIMKIYIFPFLSTCVFAAAFAVIFAGGGALLLGSHFIMPNVVLVSEQAAATSTLSKGLSSLYTYSSNNQLKEEYRYNKSGGNQNKNKKTRKKSKKI
jgi:hypothetical protein